MWLGVGIPWEEEVLGDEVWKVEASFEEFGLYVVYSTYLLLLWFYKFKNKFSRMKKYTQDMKFNEKNHINFEERVYLLLYF